ncbi:hypothetical protein MHK_007364 [Candidatus Magnetomorum sp. HK-1]|nr:hypothetical protein MHK_007364 [Candidatus Magnetomorum sp. HK-1]
MKNFSLLKTSFHSSIHFAPCQLDIMHKAVDMAEDLVSNAYQLSSRQWQKNPYDVKTLMDLSTDEVADTPYAQLIRYQARKKSSELSSAKYDYYKICVQDHNILSVYNSNKAIHFFPFILYILTHELIHIVRFSRFLHLFHSTEPERLDEERRVHGKTKEILANLNMPSLKPVLNYKGWVF